MKPSSIGVFAQILMIIVFIMLSHGAYAADVGAPLVKSDIGGVRLELIYEKYKRDVLYPATNMTINRPALPPLTVTVDGETGKQEENRVMIRLLVPISEKAILHLDAGATDSKDSEGSAPIFGGGLKYTGFEKDGVRVGMFVQGHYVPSIEYKETGFDSLGNYTYTQDESYYEVSAGLNIGKAIYLDPKTYVIPYGGLMVSVLKGKEDVKLVYTSGVNASMKGEMKEYDIIAAFAGIDVKFESNFGVHIEGRFGNQSSLSGSLFVSF